MTTDEDLAKLVKRAEKERVRFYDHFRVEDITDCSVCNKPICTTPDECEAQAIREKDE